MIIFIRTSSGKMITLEVDPEYTIERIKEMIQKKEGAYPEQQKLIYSGKYLEDDKTLAYYNVIKESVINLIIRLGGGTYCYIIYGEGESLYVSGYCGCCVNTLYLKEEIEKRLGIDKKYQELIVDGKVMKDEDSLATYGVERGKEVYLNIKMSTEEFMKLNNNNK